jgi:hypothetical protein
MIEIKEEYETKMEKLLKDIGNQKGHRQIGRCS